MPMRNTLNLFLRLPLDFANPPLFQNKYIKIKQKPYWRLLLI